MKELNNWRKFLKENQVKLIPYPNGKPPKNINYIAFVISEQSKQELLRNVKIPSGWEVVCHHMTVVTPPEMKNQTNSIEWSGELSVVALAKNDKVIAAKVNVSNVPDLPLKIPGLPHITIAVNRSAGGKPVMSTLFVESDFHSLPEPIKVTGAVKEILH